MALTNQPGAQGGMMIGTIDGHRDWTSGVFDCFSDFKSCLMTWLCLPCTMCNIASRTGECACMPFFVPGAMIALRARIRTLGGITGSIFNDCLVMSFCGQCATCQMARELDAMGL